MNWADIVASSSSPPSLPLFQIPYRHRSEVHRPEVFPGDDDSDESVVQESKFEDKTESSSDENPTMRFPDTHFGRLASIFSERMPCTGMYGPPSSMPHTATFSMHGMDSGGGTEVSGDVTMLTLEGSGAPNTNGNYGLQPSMDMPSFDEQTSVDLQQLFPTGSSHDAGMHTTNHSEPTVRSFYSAYPSHTSSVVADQDLGSSIQFSEPSHPDPNAAHLMVTFPFGGSHSEFDEQEDLTTIQDASANAMEMQEVSNLFNNTSLMTPPTAITIPRTTIVSPLNSFGPPRMMLPPNLRDLTKTESLVTAFDDEENIKFSPDRRKLCCVDDCKSQARAFNRCKRHGGSKRCSAPDCTKSVQSRGLCIRHGGGSRCQEIGCTRAAQSHGKCKMHGGGRPCVVPGCEKKAHLKRLCRKHGGGAKCSLPDCDKWAQRQGMCMTHSKHQYPMLSSSPPSPASSTASPSAMIRPTNAFLSHTI